MTGYQKQAIQELRVRGLSYSQIAESLGLSANTVKSFCRRNPVDANDASKETGNEEKKQFCKQCGQKLKHKDKAKPKTFCRDACRRAWWNNHRDQMNRKAVYRVICAHCGTAFESYGNEHRKYCTHACYILDRFGKENSHDQRAV